MSDFIDWLATNRPQRKFCFTMDNLNIHKNQMVLDLIEDAGHRVVFRAPYWSCDGAIEYVFNTLHVKLQMDYEGVTDVDELVDQIDEILFDMTLAGYSAYFEHVGFPPN
jgi:glycine/serine hydroxymethyltransferase